ncbi:unnamed protein product [Gordionus sp. m RMFG-2023]
MIHIAKKVELTKILVTLTSRSRLENISELLFFSLVEQANDMAFPKIPCSAKNNNPYFNINLAKGEKHLPSN